MAGDTNTPAVITEPPFYYSVHPAPADGHHDISARQNVASAPKRPGLIMNLFGGRKDGLFLLPGAVRDRVALASHPLSYYNI
jgi:hypothetical protein